MAPRSTSVDPVFEAFAVGLQPSGIARQRALIRRVAKRIFPRGAMVEQLTARRTKAAAASAFLIGPRSGPALTSGQAWERSREIAAEPGVRYAEPLFRAPGLEPDPRRLRTLVAPHERVGVGRGRAKGSRDDKPLPCAASNVLWSLDQIRAPEAWVLQPSVGGLQYGEGIVVAHPDTGYRKHPEIWDQDPSLRRVDPGAGYDFEGDDTDPMDSMTGANPGHGTATASVIMSARAAAGETTVVGSAPSAKLVPIRVSTSVIHLSFTNVTRAIYHAVDRVGAHVISMSLGGPIHSQALKEAIDHALERGVIVLAAAGNVWPWVVYPARFDRVIAVAACNCAQSPWRSSAHGPAVDITAPGESVWRALSQKKHGRVAASIAMGSGTSYAVAIAAGACATWLAFHGRARLLKTYGAPRLADVFRGLLLGAGFAKPSGWDTDDYGVGILDLARLLHAPLPVAATLAKVRARKTSPPRVDLATQIAGYFPDLSQARVRGVLARSLVSSVRRTATSRARISTVKLNALGPELAFHVATNAEVRKQIHDQVSRAGVKTERPTRSPFAAALPNASPTLARVLKMGREWLP